MRQLPFFVTLPLCAFTCWAPPVTVTVTVSVAVSPAGSVTVSVTVFSPELPHEAFGLTPLASLVEPPLPKSHE